MHADWIDQDHDRIADASNEVQRLCVFDSMMYTTGSGVCHGRLSKL